MKDKKSCVCPFLLLENPKRSTCSWGKNGIPTWDGSPLASCMLSKGDACPKTGQWGITARCWRIPLTYALKELKAEYKGE